MMNLLSIAFVAGDRPNFMKIVPIVRALQAWKADAATSEDDLHVLIID